MPILIVPKKNGQIRMVIDYRELNKVLKKDCYLLPKIEDIMGKFHGSKYFTTLDLNSGFYNIEVAEESKEKTAFTCFMVLYEFNRMPMGLSNSPALMQRLAVEIVGDVKGDRSICELGGFTPPKILKSEFTLDRIALLGEKMAKKCHF